MHISGRNGGVYGNELLIEDCEDAWNEHAEGGCTPSTTAGKVGTNCARVTTVAVGATTRLMTEVITKNLTTYDAVVWWARNSVGTAAGVLQLLLDDSGECPTPLESLNHPVLAANTWKLCFGLLTDPSLLASLISVGLYQVTDLADGTFDVDRVSALQEVCGIRDWTIDYTVDMHETTDFHDAGVASYIPGVSRWSGSFTGLKDGVPLAIGAVIYLLLGESNSEYQGWTGQAIITNAKPNVSASGLVEYAYDFQGTGDLSRPTA